MRVKNASRLAKIGITGIMVLFVEHYGTTYAFDARPQDSTTSVTRTSDQIRWQVISSGGTDGQSTAYDLKGTVGQTATGHGEALQYDIGHGFWQPGVIDTSCCGRYTSGLTGNVNCSADGKRNLSDVTKLIDYVYISHAELCCLEEGNTNGSVDGKVNLSDVTRLIDYIYISHAETAVCPGRFN